MSSQKAIEYTTQAMAHAATEVKGVEPKVETKTEDEFKNIIPSNVLKGSTVFNQKEE